MTCTTWLPVLDAALRSMTNAALQCPASQAHVQVKISFTQTEKRNLDSMCPYAVLSLVMPFALSSNLLAAINGTQVGVRPLPTNP